MFRSTLLSVLTVSPIGPKINTYEKVGDSNLPFAVQDYGGVNVKFYKSHPDPVIRHIAENLIFENDPKEALEQVKSGEMVYGGYLIVFDYVVPLHFTDDFGNPEVTFAKQDEWSWGLYSGYFVKRSPLADPYNKFIHTVLACGLNLKWKRDVINDLTVVKSFTASENPAKALSLENLQGSFMLFLVGMALSICAELLELMINHLSNRNFTDC